MSVKRLRTMNTAIAEAKPPTMSRRMRGARTRTIGASTSKRIMLPIWIPVSAPPTNGSDENRRESGVHEDSAHVHMLV